MGLPGLGCSTCTILIGGRVFTGDSTIAATVVLKDQRIEAVAEPSAQIGEGQRVDLSGKTILPGLFDAHVHSYFSAGPFGADDGRDVTLSSLRAFVRSGVTGILDLGSSERLIFDLRDRIASGALIGPHIFSAGAMFTATGGHPCPAGFAPGDVCRLVDTATEARASAALLLAKMPDVVKIILEAHTVTSTLPEIANPTFRALKDAADGAGVPVVAHATDVAHLTQALDGDVQIIAHLPLWDRISPALASRMHDAGVTVIPTLNFSDRFYQLLQGPLPELSDPALADDVPADVIAALQNAMIPPGVEATIEAFRANVQANFRTCLTASVTIAAGSDAGNPGNFHGLALAQELRLYVENGMRPAAALRAATSVPAAMMGVPDRGQVAAGKLADLLIVDGDPLADIGALAHVSRVFVAGREVDRQAIALTQPDERAVVTLKRDLVLGSTCFASAECAGGNECGPDHVCRASCADDSACGTHQLCESVAGAMPYCFQDDGCDPFNQTCTNLQACVWKRHGATVCVPPGDGIAGQSCQNGACQPGFVCNASNRCRQICDPRDTANNGGCPAGRMCFDLSSTVGRPAGECR